MDLNRLLTTSRAFGRACQLARTVRLLLSLLLYECMPQCLLVVTK